MQDGVGRLVARQALLGEVLVRLGQALHLGEAGVERHGGVVGVLGQVEVGGPTQLLLDDQRLLKQLEAPRKELVLDLQEVALAHVHLEGLVDDGEARVVLDVLPAAVAVDDDA